MRISARLLLLCVLPTIGACIEEWKGNDNDGDGWSVADGDCWDSLDYPPPGGIDASQIHPGATEIWYDGVDMNCLHDDDYDPDGDRFVMDPAYLNMETVGAPAPNHIADGDCDDHDAYAHPGAPDTWYDGVDSDCFGNNDYDQDYDGYTSADHLTDGTDCDDEDIAVNPAAAEVCDDVDNDCNGHIDDGTAADTIWYADTDEDGFGDPDGDTITGCDTYLGYVTDAADCDDTNGDIYPGAVEVCDDVDNDCDGGIDNDAIDATDWYEDLDEDGFGNEDSVLVACDAPAGHVAPDTDCDDTRTDVNPDAQEVCDDLDVDEDCDGLVDDADTSVDLASQNPWHPDMDSDTYGDPSVTVLACDLPAGHVVNDLDCDDTNGAINPDAFEDCDGLGIDENCDGVTDDERTWYGDTDSDGYGDASVTQDSCSTPSGYVAYDTDCDDTDADVNPGATEVCDPDDVDEDCDGDADDADSSVDTATYDTFYADSDEDSYGDPSSTTAACELPSSGYVSDDTDCDDTNSAINPGAVEVCDSSDVDQDCDGLVDDDDPDVDTSTMDTFFSDTDADGYGDVSSDLDACDQPSGYVPNDQDCDDTDGAINPGATEVCDTANVDEDCDGDADDADTSVDTATYDTFFADTDSDGYGDAASSMGACDQPTGHVGNDADCDDTDGAISPGATEVCDTLDNDCDGDIDDDDTSVDPGSFNTFYADSDTDGYGDLSSPDYACEAPSGYVADDTDCNDANGLVNPGAVEVCDALDVDEDCDGLSDDADSSVDAGTHSTFYADIDLDGYGDVSNTTGACDVPSGYVADSTDCDDAAVDTNPGATEVCDELDADEDCDGLSDDADTSVDTSTYTTWYADTDSDGYGDASSSVDVCNQPSGYVSDNTDCDDTDPSSITSAWYPDEDEDGFGDDTASPTSSCTDPSDSGGCSDEDTSTLCYVPDNTDCDDTDSSVNPDAYELYYDGFTSYGSCSDGVDNDCNGLIDTSDTAPCMDTDGDGELDGEQQLFACDPDADGGGYNDDLCMPQAFSSSWLGTDCMYTGNPYTTITLANATATANGVTFGGHTYDNVCYIRGNGVAATIYMTGVSVIGSDGISPVNPGNTSDWTYADLSGCSYSSSYCNATSALPSGWGIQAYWDGNEFTP